MRATDSRALRRDSPEPWRSGAAPRRPERRPHTHLMTRSGYLLLGLTAIVGVLAGLLAFAVAKFFAAARTLAKEARPAADETALMAAAMEDALQPPARAGARDEGARRSLRAPERRDHREHDVRPAGRGRGGHGPDAQPGGARMLGMPATHPDGPFRDVLAGAAPLADVIDECLRPGKAIVRRAVPMTGAGRALAPGRHASRRFATRAAARTARSACSPT